MDREADRRRLVKVLALLQSDRDGEALAALRVARTLLRRHGLELRDIIDVGRVGRDAPIALASILRSFDGANDH